jgi:hypothetical protein
MVAIVEEEAMRLLTKKNAATDHKRPAAARVLEFFWFLVVRIGRRRRIEAIGGG